MSDVQDYLDSKLRGFYEEMVSSALLERPKNVEFFLLNYLKAKNGDLLTGGEREELLQLRTQVSRVNNGKNSASSSEKSEDDDEEEEFIDELPMPANRKANFRVSVSAEAFGDWNKKQVYHPRVVPKSQEIRTKIMDRLEKSFMFAALDDVERNVVVNAMEEKKFTEGSIVIQQNDDGNELYLVESGKLECSKVFPNESIGKVLKYYEAGEAFGELSLLYNMPRAATIKALTDSVCWVLDRECFNHIVKDAAIKKREQYDSFLSNVELFKSMDAYERGQLADCLRSVTFALGEYVIREGEWGDIFYIIEQGTAKATKVLKPGLPPDTVKEYAVGDYFGELTMIKGEPRAANIVATSLLKCATLDRKSFKRVLGPIEEILKRDAEKYNLVLNNA